MSNAMTDTWRIVFHGENASAFHRGFADLLAPGCDVTALPDVLATHAQRAAYEAAHVIVAGRYPAQSLRPADLRLLQVPGAGTDNVDFAALPPSAIICNCFGHEDAIAEYVMAALLHRAIPLQSADHELRQGQWTRWAGTPNSIHGEISGSTVGLLGFGHIGKAVAVRARAFGMKVHVANRSAVAGNVLVDRAFPLSDLEEFWGSADSFVVSLPLIEETSGLVGETAFAAMQPHAVLINVGRGAVVDETALYNALKSHRIAAAIIDTWYRYPTPTDPHVLPATLPFHELPNLLMTPHMSGWTAGTIRRRQAVIAENIARLRSGHPLVNVVRPG
jgi:phosphoglycerate dehydrogenase-like enzyme